MEGVRKRPQGPGRCARRGRNPPWTRKRRLVWLLAAVWWKHKGALPPRSNEGAFADLVNSTAADTEWPQEAGEDATGRTITKALKWFSEGVRGRAQAAWNTDAKDFLRDQAELVYTWSKGQRSKSRAADEIAFMAYRSPGLGIQISHDAARAAHAAVGLEYVPVQASAKKRNAPR